MPSAPSPAVTEAAWEALQGAYDLQVHVAPDLIERRIDDIDLAREFLARGLRGFVLKSHKVSTAERAQVVSKAVPGISAFGAISLNHCVGGRKPRGDCECGSPTDPGPRLEADRLVGGRAKEGPGLGIEDSRVVPHLWHAPR